MFNVCPGCGMYSEEKEVLPGDGWQAGGHAIAVCPACGYAHPFLRLPLFLITGASGTGKTALALAMAGSEKRCVHLDSDILWRGEYDHPEDDYRAYRNLWLSLCKNIAQSGRPVALYGSVVPDQLEPCAERRYIGPLYTLALVCEPEVLATRLRTRPAWRNARGAEFVENMQRFNQWFIENAASCNPAITILDTTRLSVGQAAKTIRNWIRRNYK